MVTFCVVATELVIPADAGPLSPNTLFDQEGLNGYVSAMTTAAAAMPCCCRSVANSGLFCKARQMAASRVNTSFTESAAGAEVGCWPCAHAAFRTLHASRLRMPARHESASLPIRRRSDMARHSLPG